MSRSFIGTMAKKRESGTATLNSFLRVFYASSESYQGLPRVAKRRKGGAEVYRY